MTTVAPEDRPFPTFPRGKLRDEALEAWRNDLRQAIDPATGELFTEPDIQACTRELGRYWSEADNLDLVELGGSQQRGQWLADQAHPLTASDGWLKNHHGTLWNVGPMLPATGGGGTIFSESTPGTVWVGSTTPLDPVAHTVKIGAFLYQVLFTVVAPAVGLTELVVLCLDVGEETNAQAGTKPVGAIIPSGAAVEGFTIVDNFSGGAKAENAAQYARRILDEIRYRSAAGNPAQLRSWARKSSNAVEDAFIYSCALQAGSTVICLVQRRGLAVGPLARIPGLTLMAAATGYLVAPGSPVVPSHPFIVPVVPQSLPSNAVVRLTMPKNSPAGWSDVTPWPACTSQAATVTTVTTQLDIRITTHAGVLANPIALPSVMVWNKLMSSFEKLAIATVTDLGSNVYRLQLAAGASFTVAVGDHVSPGAGVAVQMALGAQNYYDSLGPGEVVDLLTSHVAHKAWRFPPPEEVWPAVAGSSITTSLRDALGGSSTNELLVSLSPSTPTLPTSPADGPRLLTLQHFAAYPA